MSLEYPGELQNTLVVRWIAWVCLHHSAYIKDRRIRQGNKGQGQNSRQTIEPTLMREMGKSLHNNTYTLKRALSRGISAWELFTTRYGLLCRLQKSVIAMSFRFALPRLLAPYLWKEHD